MKPIDLASQYADATLAATISSASVGTRLRTRTISVRQCHPSPWLQRPTNTCYTQSLSICGPVGLLRDLEGTYEKGDAECGSE